MKLIDLPRGEGKTEQLVEWAAEDYKRVILVANVSQKEAVRTRLAVRYAKIGVNPLMANTVAALQVCTVMDWFHRRGRPTGGPTGVAIDELDLVVQVMLGHIDMATLTINKSPVVHPTSEELEEVQQALLRLVTAPDDRGDRER